jgi:hypothetical protein
MEERVAKGDGGRLEFGESEAFVAAALTRSISNTPATPPARTSCLTC